MELFCLIISLLCALLFYRYHSLKQDLRSMHRQIQYQNETKSNFRNFQIGSDRDMLQLRDDIQRLHQQAQEDQTYRIQQDQAFKSMITNISHDIRTPLTSINGYLQLLEESELDELQVHYVQIMKERGGYLKELLEELFLYTKITNHGFELQYEFLNPCELLSQCILAFYELFQKQAISLKVQFDQEEQTLYADQSACNRIFSNVLNNTLRHGQNHCVIHQWVEAHRMVIEICNEVSEIFTKEEVDRLFDRFYRRDDVHRGGNSGLGLAIVKALMQQSGGDVDASYEHHQLTITLQFPLQT